MSDELQQAADRQHRWKKFGDVATADNPYWCPEDVGYVEVDQYAEDKRILADAYLAEHQEDDNELVTAQWVRSIGFTDRHQHDIDRGGLSKRHQSGSPSLFWGFEPLRLVDRWYVVENHKSVEVADLETRGRVRKLLAALGID